MINDQGFALITMMFFLVSFLSVVLLASYAVVKEAREATASYIIDRNDYRFRKALFGEVVDQCGTKLVHQGGHYSDYPDSGTDEFPTKRRYYHTRVTGRVFGTLGYPNEVEVPEDYKYTVDSFWEGYWGKRYLHILPSDKWDYTTLYPKLGNEAHDLYAPFLQPYARIFIGSICKVIPGCKNFAKGGLKDYSSFSYEPYGNVFVEVRDYSETRVQHELRLISVGCNDLENIFFERVDGATNRADYVLYKFRQVKYVTGSRIAQYSGQKKLLIQIKGNGGNSWITRDTRLIVLPPECGGPGRLSYKIKFYG